MQPNESVQETAGGALVRARALLNAAPTALDVGFWERECSDLAFKVDDLQAAVERVRALIADEPRGGAVDVVDLERALDGA